MGPRILGRGNLPIALYPPMVGMLQWGRGFWAAEMVGGVGAGVEATGFNGAADFGPRKSAITARLDGLAAASMGPRILGRGNVRHRWAAAGGYCASMGPRILGRGNARGSIAIPLQNVLQWGRGFWAAEMPVSAMPGRGAGASMGPRILGRGNDHGGVQTIQEPFASMGPRILGRGNLLFASSLGNPRLASMGPRILGRGNSSMYFSYICVHRASMGPRILGRGNLRIKLLHGNGHGLQWGRGFWAAEMAAATVKAGQRSCFNGAADFGPRK